MLLEEVDPILQNIQLVSSSRYKSHIFNFQEHVRRIFEICRSPCFPLFDFRCFEISENTISQNDVDLLSDYLEKFGGPKENNWLWVSLKVNPKSCY